MAETAPDDLLARLAHSLVEHEAARAAFELPDARYERRGELGRGGLAVVYRAWDHKLGRDVALKVLHAHLESVPAVRERFLREWRATVQLSHPNVVPVYDAGEDQGRLYLVMELVEGDPLSRLLAARRLEPRTLLALLAKVALGVQHAHEKGIIHRDLKPANILVTAAGEPKVADFGLALTTTQETALTASGATVGTPVYMAPEQVVGATATPRTDVYALGVILYQAVTGRVPHDGATAAEVFDRILNEEPVPARRLHRSIPREVELIAHKALAKEPERRYASAREFGEDLRRHLAGEPILARASSLTYRVAKRLRRHRGAALAGVAGLVLAGAVAAYVVPRWRAEAAARGESERALLAEKDRELAEAAARERARPHVDAARKLLAQLDLYLATPTWSEEKALAVTARARAECQRALELYPNHPEALLEIGRSFGFEGRRDRAAEWCGRAVAASPQFATARLERGILRLHLYEELRHRSGGRVLPTTPEGRRLLADVQEDLEAVRRWSADPQDLLCAEALLAFADGKYAEAAAALDRYTQVNPSDPRAWWLRGHALFHVEGKEREAVAALTEALKYRPRDGPCLLMRGGARRELGDFDGAIADLTEVLRLEGEIAPAYVERGRARSDKGDLEGALADFAAALRLDPRDAEAWACRGDARLDRKDLEGALADYAESLRLDPGCAATWFNRGRARAARRDFAGAIADYTEVLQREPRMVEAYVNRGLARIGKDDRAGAIADYSAALAIDPQHVIARSNRGAARAQIGDVEGAIADCTEAVRLDPRRTLAWAYRALARARQGDYGAAGADARRALELGAPERLRPALKKIADDPAGAR